jgi:hypothetical protein
VNLNSGKTFVIVRSFETRPWVRHKFLISKG